MTTDRMPADEFKRLRAAGKIKARPAGEAGRMNKTEIAYAEHLRLLQIAGDVVGFAYEPVKFRLGPSCYYTPDFVCITRDLEVVCIEIKGRRREDAMVKFRVAAETYPILRWRMVERKNRAWNTIMEF